MLNHAYTICHHLNLILINFQHQLCRLILLDTEQCCASYMLVRSYSWRFKANSLQQDLRPRKQHVVVSRPLFLVLPPKDQSCIHPKLVALPARIREVAELQNCPRLERLNADECIAGTDPTHAPSPVGAVAELKPLAVTVFLLADYRANAGMAW